MTNEKRIAFRLRDVREFVHGYSQTKIAEVLGINRSNYTDYELGRRTITVANLNNLANFYELSVDYLLCLTDNKAKTGNGNIDKKSISIKLKELRSTLNLTQQELATKVGYNKSSICSYEKMTNMITTRFCILLANSLNISIDWLLGRSDNMYIIK